MTNERIYIEAAAIVLNLVLILVSLGVWRRLGRLSAGPLRAQLFLESSAVRRFIVIVSVTTLLFVVMPVSEMGNILTDEETYELVHDISHLTFVLILLVGFLWLRRRMTPRDPSDGMSGRG